MADSETQFVFGDVPVRTETFSSQRATPDELVELATRIWRQHKLKDPMPEEKADELLAELQAEYKDFNTSFPLVLRWMVQMHQYSPKVFRQWLDRFARATNDSREGFLTLQAEYLVMLYRELHPHTNDGRLREYRQALVKQLLDEDKEFTRIRGEVEADMAKQEAAQDAERRQALYAMLMRARVEREAAAGAVGSGAEPTTAVPATAPR